METAQSMSGVDRAWLLMERPTNPMMILGLLVLAQPLDRARLRALVAERFLAFDRFRCRPETDALAARWVPCAGFDLDDHVLSVGLPGAAGQHELETLVGQLASTQLSPQRPMWSFHLVESFQGGSAIVVRIHHCYADGIALVRVLLSLADTKGSRQPAAPLPAASQPSIVEIISQTIGEGAQLLEKGMHYVLHPAEAVTTARETAGLAGELAHLGLLSDDPPSCLKRPLSGVRRVAWSTPFPLEDVRTVAHVLGCSINDVLVASLAGALGHFLEERGEGVKGMRLRAAVPVNLRTEGDGTDALGNRFGLVFLELPVGLPDPFECLESVRATMQSLKGSPQALVTLGLLALIGSLPTAVEEPVTALFSAKASLVVSNVPGPREPLTFGGVPVSQAQFWVPQAGSIGVGVSMLTYNGTVQFGVISDRALIAEPAELVRMMREEFERLVLLLLLGALAQASPRRARSTSSLSIASAGTQAAALS